jgi:hypothetical protein
MQQPLPGFSMAAFVRFDRRQNRAKAWFPLALLKKIPGYLLHSDIARIKRIDLDQDVTAQRSGGNPSRAAMDTATTP